MTTAKDPADVPPMTALAATNAIPASARGHHRRPRARPLLFDRSC